MNDCGHQPIIDQLVAKVAHLEAALLAALEHNAELEPPPTEPSSPPLVVKSNQRQPRAERRKRDPQHNQARHLSLLPAATIDHALNFCPKCGYRLQGQTISYQRELIDLPAPQPAVIELHRFISRYCPCCEQTCTPKASEVLADWLCGQSRFGNAYVVWLACC